MYIWILHHANDKHGDFLERKAFTTLKKAKESIDIRPAVIEWISDRIAKVNARFWEIIEIEVIE